MQLQKLQQTQKFAGYILGIQFSLIKKNGSILGLKFSLLKKHGIQEDIKTMTMYIRS